MADTISAAELQTAMLAATNAVKDFGTNVKFYECRIWEYDCRN